MTPNGYRVSVGGDEVSNRPVIAAQLGIGLKPSDCPSGVGKLPFEFVSTKLFEKTVLCSKRTRLHIMKKTNKPSRTCSHFCRNQCQHNY